MIVFIQPIKEKVFLEETDESMLDPTTNKKGLHFAVCQGYFDLLIPVLPLERKLVKVYSLTTGERILNKEWTPEITEKAKQLKKQAKGTWKLFMLCYILLILILSSKIYSSIQNSSRDKVKEEQELLFNDPKINDVLYVKVYDSGNSDNTNYTTLFKIAKIDGDSLYLLPSTLKGQDGVFIDPAKILDVFPNVSDTDFTSDTLIFRTNSFTKKRLSSFEREKPGDASYFITYLKR